MSEYEDNATKLVKNVIPSTLKSIVNIFMIDAGINMGNDFTDSALERSIEIVQNNFRFLPVYYVASAFKKGSLGNYGPGRLVPRVIYHWLNEITMEYNQDQDHKKLTEVDNNNNFKDLEKYPFGKAICLKIDWYRVGIINSDDWDKIPLKELAEMIGRGQHPTIEDFGIKQIKT